LTLFGPEGAGPEETAQIEPAQVEPAQDAGPSTRVRLTVAYDGTGFRGFAAQAGQVTVGGTLSEAIEKVVGHPVSLTCAGRTDAGVHAWGQVVHADLTPPRRGLDLDALVRSCNAMLSPAIVLRAAQIAPEGFDARRSALSRVYRYRVLSSATPDPFLAATTWHVEHPLDLRAMEQATDPLLGEHDFSSFCRRAPDGGSLVRRVLEARWTREERSPGRQAGPSTQPDQGELLRFEIEANAFCHQMVRSVVGTLVEVGRGRRRAGDLAWILRVADRAQAAAPAPAHGLCLWAVLYPDY
jgi:tRNA pseudouridine38-40 synthase